MLSLVSGITVLISSVLSLDGTGNFAIARAAIEKSGCYDFATRPTQPMKDPSTLPDAEPPGISKKSGRLPPEVYWASVRGVVQRPIQDLVEELSIHETTRSKRIDDLTVTSLPDPAYWIRQKVHYEVDPFLFIKVKWVEDWAFFLSRGTPSAPERIVALYEKTEGTSHIPHLCGSYVFERKGPKATDVFIYEEAQASGRTEKDELNGLVGTIRTFRRDRS